ncbi:PIN domain-containing protein [Thiomonas sp.]
MIVLDTNVVSEAMKPEPHPAVRAWLNDQAAETLYLSSVTLADYCIEALASAWARITEKTSRPAPMSRRTPGAVRARMFRPGARRRVGGPDRPCGPDPAPAVWAGRGRPR